MISYKDFENIVLTDFVVKDVELIDSPDWEWMDCLWYCQRFGFSWSGQLESMKNKTGALELDLKGLNKKISISVFERLKLPLFPGIKEQIVEKMFDIPIDSHQFVKGRITKYYIFGNQDKYYISCTYKSNKLIWISILRYDIYKKSIK